MWKRLQWAFFLESSMSLGVAFVEQLNLATIFFSRAITLMKKRTAVPEFECFTLYLSNADITIWSECERHEIPLIRFFPMMLSCFMTSSISFSCSMKFKICWFISYCSESNASESAISHNSASSSASATKPLVVVLDISGTNGSEVWFLDSVDW